MGGGVPIPGQRLSRALCSVPIFSLLCFLSTMVPVPPYPPFKIHPGSLPSSAFLTVSSLFLPIASSLSVSILSAVHLQQRLSPVACASEVYNPPADCQQNALLLVSCPASRMRVCTPPRPVRLVVLGLGVGGGAKDTAPPAMLLSSSTH